jgi:hypothetical protein
MNFIDHYHLILLDCHYLKRFMDTQRITRGYWDGIPAVHRKRIMDLGYVRLASHMVQLTVEGLEVLGYREATA